MSKTIEDKQKFIELRAKGYSYAKIAEQINVSKPTLIQWSQEDATFRNINNLRALHLDELQEKYAISKQHRIEVFSELLEKVKAELATRDLSELSTIRLVSLNIRLLDAVRRDDTKLQLLGEPEVKLFSDMLQPKSWTIN
jgi:transcriptional regulator with XRE-family HTH domain